MLTDCLWALATSLRVYATITIVINLLMVVILPLVKRDSHEVKKLATKIGVNAGNAFKIIVFTTIFLHYL